MTGTAVLFNRVHPLSDHPRKWGWYKEVAGSAGFEEGRVVIEGGLKTFHETWGVEEPDYDELWKEGMWFAAAAAENARSTRRAAGRGAGLSIYAEAGSRLHADRAFFGN